MSMRSGAFPAEEEEPVVDIMTPVAETMELSLTGFRDATIHHRHMANCILENIVPVLEQLAGTCDDDYRKIKDEQVAVYGELLSTVKQADKGEKELRTLLPALSVLDKEARASTGGFSSAGKRLKAKAGEVEKVMNKYTCDLDTSNTLKTKYEEEVLPRLCIKLEEIDRLRAITMHSCFVHYSELTQSYLRAAQEANKAFAEKIKESIHVDMDVKEGVKMWMHEYGPAPLSHELLKSRVPIKTEACTMPSSWDVSRLPCPLAADCLLFLWLNVVVDDVVVGDATPVLVIDSTFSISLSLLCV